MGGDVAGLRPGGFGGRRRGRKPHRERCRRRRRSRDHVRSGYAGLRLRPTREVRGRCRGATGRASLLPAGPGQGRLTTVALEKFQVAALAERLDELLDEVLRRSGGQRPGARHGAGRARPTTPPSTCRSARTSGSAPWRWPGTPTPRRWSSRRRRSSTRRKTSSPSARARDAAGARISAGAARAFTQRALELVAAGRPPCPLCAQPLDAEGHICVRLNGYRGGEAASYRSRRRMRADQPR